jgi:hypothetical protein
MGQSAGFLEIVIRPVLELSEPMLGEEIRPSAPAGYLPSGRLGAFLAKLEGMGVSWLGPGTADARKAVELVLPQQLGAAADRHALAAQHGA